MSQLLALLLKKPEIPKAKYEALQDLQSEGRLDLLDFAEVEITDNCKLKFEMVMRRPDEETRMGRFLPALIGLLFFKPEHRTNDNVERTLKDMKLDLSFAQKVLSAASPKNSILFLHLSEQSPTDVARLGVELQVFQLELNSEQELKLEDLFKGQNFVPGNKPRLQTEAHH